MVGRLACPPLLDERGPSWPAGCFSPSLSPLPLTVALVPIHLLWRRAAEQVAAWQKLYEHISLADAGAMMGFVPVDEQRIHKGASALLEEHAEEGKCQTSLMASEAAQQHSLALDVG